MCDRHPFAVRVEGLQAGNVDAGRRAATAGAEEAVGSRQQNLRYVAEIGQRHVPGGALVEQ